MEFFDEKYVIDFSETEFCFRAKIAKFKISSINTNIYHQTMPDNNSHILKDRILNRPETYYYTFRNKFFIARDFFNVYNKILFIILYQFVTLFAYLAYSIKVKSLRLFKSYFLGFVFGNVYFFFGKIISYEKVKKLFNNFNWLSPESSGGICTYTYYKSIFLKNHKVHCTVVYLSTETGKQTINEYLDLIKIRKIKTNYEYIDKIINFIKLNINVFTLIKKNNFDIVEESDFVAGLFLLIYSREVQIKIILLNYIQQIRL